MKRNIVIVLLLLAAWQYKSLSGQYRIAGKTVIDPPPSIGKIIPVIHGTLLQTT
ncbi:hypothetical protein [Nitrosomonas ureae]|uniref:Uncharacterized protein n=1 Tax=Nitrosomonas ureae TaxID=44577 RepID=A0A1H5UFH9_9PROT|nr:hypothetical protein [Nitrosomonas ureae]SEF73208.1 hypothetical protein SAMN05216334_107111 [Nitrosomonas ureae]